MGRNYMVTSDFVGLLPDIEMNDTPTAMAYMQGCPTSHTSLAGSDILSG